MLLSDSDVVDTAALAYARGDPPALGGIIRGEDSDFRVDEDCPVTLTGIGEHLWCRIEKRGLNTQDAVQALSRAAGVHPRHIGFAGLKDRRAVTTQWLSLAWPIHAPLPELDAMAGVRVLEMARHERKLRRGAHRGNWFVITVRGLRGDDGALEDDLMRIRVAGVPNFFGAQRFGRDGRNIALARALFAGRRLSRSRRGFGLSAARALLFNAVLDARVRDGSWNSFIDGEAVMLDGSHSVFAYDRAGQSAQTLIRRLDAGDIHPSGPLPGRGGDDIVAGETRALETRVLAAYSDLADGLAAAGVDAARRALRVPVRELEWTREVDRLRLSFWLPAGVFATSVLREILRMSEPHGVSPG